MKVVSNTTPLVYLSKSALLIPLLKTLHQSVLITEEVCEEAVVKGESRGYKDALTIKDAVRDWITVKKVTGDIFLHLMDRMHKERLNEVIKSLGGLSEAVQHDEIVTGSLQCNPECLGGSRFVGDGD